MDEEVRIPLKLDINTNDLDALKQEISKTFEDVRRYESKLSSKGDVFKLKGLSELEQSLNNTVANMANQMEKFEKLRFDTPKNALEGLRNSVKQLGEELRADKADIKDISKAIEESQSDIKQGQTELSQITKERNQLEKEYQKSISKISSDDKGAKTRLENLKKEYDFEMQSLAKRESAANTLVNVGKYNLANSQEALKLANDKLHTDEKDIAELRAQRDEMYNISRSEKRTNDYIAERTARMKQLNAEIIKQKDAIFAGSGAAREKLEEDAAKTGVSYRSKYEEAIQKQKEAAAKEELQIAKDKAKAESVAAKEAEKATQRQIASLNREKTAVRETAAQYYYKLRSIKMLGFTISSINSKIDNFGKNMLNGAKRALGAYLKLIPGVALFRKHVDKAATSQRRLNKEINTTTKSHGDFNESINHGIKNLLRYGFGIRSLFVLFNRLRHTMIDGLGQLSQKYSEVNQQMSSVVSSMNQMKAAVTSVVQPLLNVLAPALEKIAAVVADIAYKVASFIAALTGQSFVFKATRQQVDYAASLDKTAKSAKEATKELGKYDKLNVIHKDDKGGSDDGGVGAMGFEKVPIDSTMADWAKKFKDFLNRLFAPIKKAWEKWKNFVIAGWKYAGRELLKLAKDIARDFWRVWEEPETQLIFENIFHTLGNIGYIVGNLARNFREAWNEAENGYRILKSIRDIFLILSDALVRISTYMTAWSDQLSFIPLLHTLADVMEKQLVPAVQKVVDLFVYLFDEIILKIVKDFIEKGLPQALRIAGNLVEAIGNIAENLRIALEDSDRGVQIVEKIEGLIGIVADHIESASEKTKDWAENLNFIPLLEAADKFLDDMKPVISFISDTLERLWENVLLPFWKYLIEDGLPKLLDTLGEISNNIDWNKLTENINNLVDALEPIFEFAWEVLLQIIEDLGTAFGDFLNSDTFSGVIQNIKDFADSLNEMTAEERAQKVQEFAKNIESLAGKIIGFKAALTLADKFILPFVENLMTFQNVANNMQMQKSLGTISKDIKALKDAAKGGATAVGAEGLAGAIGGGEAGASAGLVGSLGALAVPIGIVVGFLVLMVGAFGGLEETLKRFKELFDDVTNYFKEFAEEADISGSLDNLKESFDQLKVSLEFLRPIFEVWFQWLGAMIKLEIGKIISAIDFLMTFISGFVKFISGIFKGIAGIIKINAGILTLNFDLIKEGITDFGTGIENVIKGVIDVIGSFVEFFGDRIANIIGVIFPDAKTAILGWIKDTKDAVSEWVDKVIGFFSDLKYKLIGDPIVYDIRDGIIEGFTSWIKDTWDGVKNWVKDVKDAFIDIGKAIKEKVGEIKKNIKEGFANFKETAGEKIVSFKDGVVNKFTELKDSMTSDSKTATDNTTNDFTNMNNTILNTINSSSLNSAAQNYIKGFMTGVTTVWGQMVTLMTNNINNFTKLFQTKFTVSTINPQGKNFITGFKNGMTSVWGAMTSEMRSKINSLINEFKNKLSKNTLYDTGRNLIEGLKKGMISELKSTLREVKAIADEIVATAKQAFEVHSPSKIFMEIGQFLMQGLQIGVEDGTDEIAKMFESIVPDESITDSFEKNFLSALTDMKSNAVYIVSSMVDEIEAVMASLEYANMMNSMYSQLNNVKAIQVPNIVSGKQLPTNANFKQSDSKNSDLSRLPDIIREAIEDAVNTINTDSNKAPIMLQLDSRVLAEAVWDEEEKRYKQRGDYRPFYT